MGELSNNTPEGASDFKIARSNGLEGWSSSTSAFPDTGLSGVDDGSPFPLTLRTVADVYPVGDLTEEELAQERDTHDFPL